MSDETAPQAKGHTGGCLCGAVRYELAGEPRFAGYCFCADCRKASGSGFVGFMAVASSDVRFSGETRIFRSKSARGGEAVRNFCPVCGSLIFGGIVGVDTSHTIYAGSLDDPAVFRPTIAIFNRDRPVWALMPPGLTVFETMPS
ncbi:MAG TPA: GFA family protein [Acetobacteraceae bacterium]|nr:GFA family protein [Acetobacteraceae bacterium]HUB14507.1 GFA family protein [Acetobacteraceae bacterium]HUB46273.1 GFA family protein [Acetobacteraceae bacterium]